MENFAGYIDLKDGGEYQEIYSSQLYGTFFGIFSVFERANELTGDNYHLKQMELKIINYKGVCDLGMTDAKLFKIQDTEDRFILKIEVQAMNGSATCTLDCEDIEIPKNGAEILVDRRVKKMHPDGSALRDGLFDTEFYYREGLPDVPPKPPYEEKRPKPLVWSDALPEEELDDFVSNNITKGGSKCPRRRIKVL